MDPPYMGLPAEPQAMTFTRSFFGEASFWP